MLRRINHILMIAFLMINFLTLKGQSGVTKSGHLKNDVSDANVTTSYFSIQILALKANSSPNDATFFDNIDKPEVFICQDGYKRYVVGRYATKAEAQASLSKIRAKGIKFAKAFVVNTGNFNNSTVSSNDLSTSSSSRNDKLSRLRTSKKIIPVDVATEPFFAIQILALRNAPQEPSFFENVNSAREFNCQDGFARYVFGQFNSYEEAQAELNKTKSLSSKYSDAFVVNTANYKISSAAFSKEFNPGEKADDVAETNLEKTNNVVASVVPITQLSPDEYSVQVLAVKDVAKDSKFFDKLGVEVKELACTDGLKRYLVGPFSEPEQARITCNKIRKLGSQYSDAFIVKNDRLKIDKAMLVANPNKQDKATSSSKLTSDQIFKETLKNTAANRNADLNPATPTTITTAKGEYQKTSTERLVDSKREISNPNDNSSISSVEQEQPASVRTDKKIFPMDKATKPFFTIQILAIKDAPKDPMFFDNIESAREFSCTDGYKRYVVGQYETRDEAAADLEKIRNLSPKYKNAFIANTANYEISLDDFRSDYSNSGTNTKLTSEKTINNDALDDESGSHQKSELNKIEKSSAEKITTYDPNKTYTIQLTASRYPFYVTELKEFKEVFEFYMPDKVYRYTVGNYSGNQVSAELKKVISLGYSEAFAVEWNKYLPYKIE